MNPKPIVHIVDDDFAIRDSLSLYAKSTGLGVKIYSSATEFLDKFEFDPASPGILVTDLRMPGMSGLELHENLRERNIHLPTIITSGHTNELNSVKTSDYEDVEFIQKPFLPQDLSKRIQQIFDPN